MHPEDGQDSRCGRGQIQHASCGPSASSPRAFLCIARVIHRHSAATTRDAGFHSLPLTAAGNARPAPTPVPPDAGADLGSAAYFWVTAPLATPPPDDCTQIVVGRNVVACLNCQVPSAARRTLPTGTPVQLAPLEAAAPAQMVTPAAKLPPGIWVLVPSTRSSPEATVSSLRVIVTVSFGAAFTTWFRVGDVLMANVALPL